MASTGRLCHAGQLLKLGCSVEAGSWRRVCSKCMETYAEALHIPAGRCRYLTRPCGTFGGGRNFFVAWTHPMGSIDGVRPMKLNASANVLLVFVEESVAQRCEETLPAGTLVRVDGESVTLRLCAGAKSFCPDENFPSCSARTCNAHVTCCAAFPRPL